MAKFPKTKPFVVRDGQYVNIKTKRFSGSMKIDRIQRIEKRHYEFMVDLDVEPKVEIEDCDKNVFHIYFDYNKQADECYDQILEIRQSYNRKL